MLQRFFCSSSFHLALSSDRLALPSSLSGRSRRLAGLPTGRPGTPLSPYRDLLIAIVHYYIIIIIIRGGAFTQLRIPTKGLMPVTSYSVPLSVELVSRQPAARTRLDSRLPSCPLVLAVETVYAGFPRRLFLFRPSAVGLASATAVSCLLFFFVAGGYFASSRPSSYMQFSDSPRHA